MACERHSWWFDTPCPACAKELAAAVTVIGPDHDTFEPDENVVVLSPEEIAGEQAAVEADLLDIPPFLKRVRLWRDDGMAWVEGTADLKPGDEWTWAGHRVRAVMQDGGLRYKELSYTPPERQKT